MNKINNPLFRTVLESIYLQINHIYLFHMATVTAHSPFPWMPSSYQHPCLSSCIETVAGVTEEGILCWASVSWTQGESYC